MPQCYQTDETAAKWNLTAAAATAAHGCIATCTEAETGRSSISYLCTRWDGKQAAANFQSGIMATSRVLENTQVENQQCGDDFNSCVGTPWTTTATTKHYIAGIEGFTVLIDNTAVQITE